MIYVDKLFEVSLRQYHGERVAQAARNGARHGHRWCHMWTDGPAEDLHAFAKKLGMRREWYQPGARLPHYDLVPSKRVLAVKLGAIEADVRDFIRRKTADFDFA